LEHEIKRVADRPSRRALEDAAPFGKISSSGATPVAAGIVAATGPISETLAILKADLEGHEKRIAELRDLLAGLAAYTTSGHGWPDPPPSKPRIGRPPLDPAAKARTRRRDAMRKRRAALKASAKAKAASDDSKKKSPVAAEATKPKHGKREMTPAERKELEEIGSATNASDASWQKAKKADPDFRTIREVALRNRRRGGQLLKKLGPRVSLPLSPVEIKHWYEAALGDDLEFEAKIAGPPKQQISPFTEDEHGVKTRVSMSVDGHSAAAPLN
jgi:hypothetical protein